MTQHSNWKQIKEIFDNALKIEGQERQRYIEKACGDDEELVKEIYSLIAAHAKSGPLDKSLENIRHTALSGEDFQNLKGREIGPYKIKADLGHGGMGNVFLAERADGQYDQKVALKILRIGFTNQNQVRRFIAERQILASLNHPNIATLLDGGLTEDGQPWFALEYVKGSPIDKYCNTRRLNLKKRLNLFLKVCGAVQTAHQQLIIHRDLKPSNILVTDDGTVKLLDFGIAKVLNQEDLLSEAVPLTRTGLLPLTPAYASPEQIRGNPISTASDIYQLGIILYELLTGIRPYEVSGRTPSEIERIICETQPERPSTAVTKLTDSKNQNVVFHSRFQNTRQSNPDQLRKRLLGDLDTIVMKTLRKEPDRRYESAEQLAADIRHYLAGRPVTAHPDSRSYRTRKFVSRHKTGFSATVVIILMLIGYATSITYHSQQTQAALSQAQTETAKAEQVTEFLLSLFEASDPAETLGDTVTARVLLERGVQQAEELNNQPEVQAQMFDLTGQIYSRLGNYNQAFDLLSRALSIRNQQFGEEDITTASTKVQLATIMHKSGNYENADSLLREALSIQRKLLGSDHQEVASTLSTLGGVLMGTGSYDEAESMLRQALQIQRQSFDDKHLDISETLNILGLLLDITGDLDEAESAMREALEIRRELLSDLDPRVTMSLNNLGMLLRKKGDYKSAEPVYREALELKRSIYGDEHPSIATTLNGLGLLLKDMGNDVEAEPVIRESLAMRRAFLDENHPRIAESLNNLGNLLESKGELEEAAVYIGDTREKLKHTFGDMHPLVAYPTIGLARISMKQENYQDAEPLIRDALAIRENALPGDHPEVIEVMNMLGDCLIRNDNYDDAESILLQAYEITEDRKNDFNDLWRETIEHLIRLYNYNEQPDNVAEFRDLLSEANIASD